MRRLHEQRYTRGYDPRNVRLARNSVKDAVAISSRICSN